MYEDVEVYEEIEVLEVEVMVIWDVALEVEVMILDVEEVVVDLELLCPILTQ